MGLTDWMGTFSRARDRQIGRDLQRAVEAARTIEAIEREHFSSRPVRFDQDLPLPRATQAQLRRRFQAALLVCRSALGDLEEQRSALGSEAERQLRGVEEVLERYDPSRAQPAPRLSRAPDVLPRSLLGMLDNLRRQLDPQAEANLLEGFRRRRDATLVSLRILLLLVLVPLLMQQLSRSLVVSPLVDRLAPDTPFLTYPRPALEEAAVEQLRVYKEEVEFDALLRGRPVPQPEEMHSLLAERARLLKEEADQSSSEAVKNVLSDLVGLLGFVLMCLLGRREIQVLKAFLDELIYGLSDSAKAFAIILFTDIFVGFHSPEGWTVLLNGLAHHLGLPAQENFIMLFIATFPVVLATVFKYWIFRYLNRVSPSSVATLRNMNGGG
ncbi:proton extrusion protein PcxA [Cyanobium sp. CH-040]|uniref:proton extrusion protein PcxA n=1 Tax=Cyanobium sp. CH-040 TaxID=2823708 RepID=UPI0020CB7862|nr:proton extrusion protein PcxA [Cyanobium sp. CH-040]MCP9926957.1 proton extrusion protein PcxA [Cyanobium sp. CH-040]